MKQNFENRIIKLENAMMPPKLLPRVLLTYANQCGSREEVIREETDDEAIARHLNKHPEDAGREFKIICISSVHGKWNDEGELLCDMPECSHFNTASH